MAGFFKVVGGIFLLLIGAFFLGPRPDTSQTITFDKASIGDDLDAYLENAESGIGDLREGLHKEIVWNNPATKEPTDFAVVYIHGFSASKVETEPVPHNLAKALNANLFLTRLSGHGRSGDAMAEPRMADWLDDTVEAIAIGERIGKKLLLVSTSTGGTLSTWAAANPEYAERIAGLIMISPNYAIKAASTGLMNMPWAETLLPLALGAERSFEPVNEGHGKGWTSTYPSRAVFAMAALLRVVEHIDKSQINTPALFIYSDGDKVVVPTLTDQIVNEWGGPTQIEKINNSNDPYNHVIAGDILSPNTTEEVTQAAIKWANKL